MRRSAWQSAVITLVGSALLTGCDDAGDSPAAPAAVAHKTTVAKPGSIPASAQRPGNASAGRRALVEEAYVECGLPMRVMRELLGDAGVIGLPDREAAAEGLPFTLNASRNADGVELATSNCLTCHGTPLFGELVIGLGNEFADFTGDPSLAVERAGALVQGPDETAVWERYADRVGAIAPYMRMQTVGTNPANNLTFALIAHRDPDTNAWLDTPALALPSRTPPPVSVPPWWRMAKKHAMFSMGEGRGDHGRLMMSASMLCTDSIEALEAIDTYAPDVAAYIKSLEPPVWPFDVERDLAAKGRDLFMENCSECHGSYAVDAVGERDRNSDTYPDRLVAIGVVDTDPTLVNQTFEDAGKAFTDWFNRSWYGQMGSATSGAGYVAPPLDGIWATAPFLHNGSVPTVRHLLDSESRPVRWSRIADDASDPDDYDPVDLGWRLTSSARLDSLSSEQVYDTARAGHANTGHRFGDHLSDAERSAVIEYLKTL